ncbi:oligopeptide ABC transporter permease OppB [Abyssibacter profundi]|uniref:Oligopeptide ABC transporter permease OppB n=1 Tax=Abyssibacter profundi TaxID=2182787 RepID=A0A383XRR2_9GAMM|nr:oligopeptide ABC transporter permease OppB [Abyssibacter profundi]PWN55316.1 oligopeptide ABC transporter permease OppB [Abyssibacter profundi]
MLSFALKRLTAAIPTLLVLITLAFFMMRLAPGGPFDLEKPVPPEVRANLDAAYGLDKPLLVQYANYLGDVLQGDLGPSFQYVDYSVNELIAQGFPVSLKLGISAMIVAVVFGSLFGMIAAMRQNSVTDYSMMTVAMTGISIPNFVVAPLLILVFAVALGWLPAGGWNNGAWPNMVLPVIALALPQVAYVARIMRGSMIEVLRSNYLRTARAKGLPMRQVMLRHALKPAFLPVLSYLGPATAGIITGSVVMEQIFSIPGLGRFFVQGALNRDYTLVLGVVIFYGALIIVFNFLVDLLYSVLDPKVRAQ